MGRAIMKCVTELRQASELPTFLVISANSPLCIQHERRRARYVLRFLGPDQLETEPTYNVYLAGETWDIKIFWSFLKI